MGTPLAWNVYLNGRRIDTIFTVAGMDAEEVKSGLVDHDGYDPGIRVRRNRELSDDTK